METSLQGQESQGPGGLGSPAAPGAPILSGPPAIDNARYRPALGILRTTAAFGVVALHTSGLALTGAPHGTATWWIGDFYQATTLWCVPVFIMISGALLLNPAPPQPVGVFYRKRTARILAPLVFWTVFYLGWYACFEGISWQYVVRGLIRGNPYGHLWYLYMIAGLYFITPVLQPFLRDTSRREQIAIIVPLLAAVSAHDLINTLTASAGKVTVFSRFVPYLPYYLSGYLLAQATVLPRRVKYLATGALTAWLIIALATGLLFPRVEMYFFGHHCPLVILMAMGVFLAASGLFGRARIDARHRWKILRFLDDKSLGVYLIHPLFITLLLKLGLHTKYIIPRPLASIPVLAVLVLLASLLLTSLLKAVPALRRVV